MSNPKAAMVVIGNEILSGRTLDTNTQSVAKALSEIGVDLVETCTIPDDMSKIINSVQTFSNEYDYVFTSGGIGPTHDDITSESISKAFDVPYELSREALDVLISLYKPRDEEITPAREKMAWMPKGAEVITYNPPSAPAYRIKNVYVLAGVPYILQAMLKAIMPTLRSGDVIESRNIDVMLGESVVAGEFAQLQEKYPDIDMGSYPFKIDGEHGTSLVLRSNDYKSLELAYKELAGMLDKYK